MAKTNDCCDVAWLAGLLEGEGWFGDAGRTRGGRHAVVRVRMTDRDVVERVAIAMGGVKVQPAPGRKPGYKDTYRAQVCGRRAVELMRTVRPHMGDRRGARIDELLEVY